MANNKNHKAQPVRSSQYMPKAGPKKPGSKPRKRAGMSRNTDLPLFAAIAKDQADMKRPRFTAAEQAEQAERIVETPNNATHTVAIQIIRNFPKAKANPAYNLSRTQVAVNMLSDQLDPKLLKNKNAMSGGTQAAKTALLAAYKRIERELTNA